MVQRWCNHLLHVHARLLAGPLSVGVILLVVHNVVLPRSPWTCLCTVGRLMGALLYALKGRDTLEPDLTQWGLRDYACGEWPLRFASGATAVELLIMEAEVLLEELAMLEEEGLLVGGGGHAPSLHQRSG